MKVFGQPDAHTQVTLGPEQEYFLIDKKFYLQRPDLLQTGRTLFGAPPAKHQQLEDHYFGAIKPRILNFMNEVEMELWKLGIPAKTRHNEVAPAQFELAPMFEELNLAVDHNMMIMEVLRQVADRHGLVCLLHEKPLAGVNGSGKHNNWSLSADDGQNLLEPGRTPSENEQFLIFVSAMIMAVDRHAAKLRAGCGNPGNDLRLGANEAPPAIISIFMGDEFTEILQGIAAGKKVASRGQHFVQVGVDSLPHLPKDNTDRNRTSPFAFTGNKFEFRMVGSSASISGPNIVINTIAAEALDEIATRLEKAGKANLHKEAQAIVRDAMKKHGRVIFNGNNYSDEWIEEAKKRGLPNVRTSVEALASMASLEAVKLFEKYKVLSKEELDARYEIYLEIYAKHVNIEAQAAVQMVKRQYLPAVIEFTKDLAKTIAQLKSVAGSAKVQKELLAKVTDLLESADEKLETLEATIGKAHAISDSVKRAEAFRDKVVVAMNALRKDIDALEGLVPAKLWPVPTYAEMLFKL